MALASKLFSSLWFDSVCHLLNMTCSLSTVMPIFSSPNGHFQQHYYFGIHKHAQSVMAYRFCPTISGNIRSKLHRGNIVDMPCWHQIISAMQSLMILFLYIKNLIRYVLYIIIYLIYIFVGVWQGAGSSRSFDYSTE